MKKQLFNQEGTIELIEGTSTLVFHDNLPDRKEHDIPKIETKRTMIILLIQEQQNQMELLLKKLKWINQLKIKV